MSVLAKFQAERTRLSPMDRRIADVMRIPQKRASLRDVAKYVPDPKRFARKVAEHLREGGAL